MNQNDLVTRLISHFESLRPQAPVVLNLTNYVAMDLSANVLLASGASPIMAHAPEEIEELVQIAGAVVINIGTLDEEWVRSFRLTNKLAKGYSKPVVLDPVGCGATTYRTKTAQRIFEDGVAMVRGNASEIQALFIGEGKTKGVDSALKSGDVSANVRRAALNDDVGFVITGEVDHVWLGEHYGTIENGDPIMTKVTAMGCSASALVAALLAVTKNRFEASLTAMAMMGVCGELAKKNSHGPASFRTAFLDQLYALDAQTLRTHMRVRYHEA